MRADMISPASGSAPIDVATVANGHSDALSL
jgi:hypothetical protein